MAGSDASCARARIEIERLVVVGDGAIELAFGLMSDAAVEVSGGVFWMSIFSHRPVRVSSGLSKSSSRWISIQLEEGTTFRAAAIAFTYCAHCANAISGIGEDR